MARKTEKRRTVRSAPKKAKTVGAPVTIRAGASRRTDEAAAPREDLIRGNIHPAGMMRGPRKTRRVGAPPPRLSNHKIRSQWFRARAAYPVREAPVFALVRERDRVAKSLPQASLAGAQWEQAGPTNIGGRMTSLVCHPSDPDRIWAGAAGGGVWFSPDAGQTWQPQWHSEDVLNVGSLAIDPTDPEILYCGTGEANLSADSYGGVGIYRTIDGGASWHLFASRAATGIPARIGVIAIDPFDRLHLILGGVGYAEMGSSADDLGGMYVSFNGGVTWAREEFVSKRNYWCHSIAFDPATPGRIYATFTAQGHKSGIYRSVDGGKSWTKLTKGLPSGDRFGRTSLALAPSNPRVIYALAADQLSNHADLILGVFRSTDGGDSWRNIAGNHFDDEGQLNYGTTIVVHPAKPNRVLCGGVDLHLTLNGGSAWTRVTRWDVDRKDPDYAHADHHCLVMPAGAPGRVYDANDGGLDVSDNGGTRWTNRSNGLTVSMSYDADVAQSDERVYGTGLQDNGTVITVSGNRDMFSELLGGDGGFIAWDPNDAEHVYASYQFFNIFRFRNGTYINASPPAPVSEQESVWMCFIALDPNDSDTVFTGSYRVWRTRDDGQTWLAVSPPLDGSVISAIEIAESDSDRIYVGTENGGIFRSDDRGQSWSANISSSELPGFTITRLATSPRDANVIYATVANFGPSHVFRSLDGGHTWDDIDHGQLPGVPHHVVAVIDRNGTDELYVGSDAGVFTSDTGGQTWRNISRNLPNTMVVDLVHHAAQNTLVAATYGRSMWRLKL
jgi:photosystem II stability/assembly factor-like uncharacterized protein